MKPSLGAFADTGAPATISVDRLVESRMLLQAGSGGGKSWALRRILEQTAGKVQQIVIDPDGEFATLREKFDYVIAAAHDGDALAHPRTAALLARRLLETGVSAIIDIYDLKKHERLAFVRILCETIVDAPKDLWHPALIVIDEAHIYCPEQDKAESAGAVIDLASRGRKRGYSLLAATQRIAKLSKDCAAELHNKLIGLTTLDVDVKRAAFELGLQPAEAMRELRALQPGEFFGFGPALWPTVRKLKTGDVQTTHPKAGKRSLQAPPKPTEAIKAVLPKLANLPKEAEAEARSIEELKRELASARRELALAARQRPTPAPAAPTVSRRDLKTAEDRGYARGHTDGAREAQRAATTHLRTVRARLHQALDAALAAAPTPALPGAPAPAQLAKPRDAAPAPSQSRPVPAPIPARTAEPPRPVRHAGNGTADPAIGRGGKQRILATLAQHGRMPERRLGLLAGLSTRGGTWSTYLSALRQAGYIEGSDELAITEAGLAALGSYETLPTGEALIDYWRGRVGGGGRRAIFDALVAAYPNAVDQDELAAAVNLSSAGGTWSTYLSTLRTMELITGKRELRASDELFS